MLILGLMNSSPTTLIGAEAAAEMLGIDRSHLSRLVRMGVVPVAMQMPGKTGARLFDPKEMRRIRIQRDKAAS